MNRAGKTSTIFLIIFAVLLISLTAITVFFFQQERELRQKTQQKLDETVASETRLTAELGSAQKEIFVLKEKNKEADEKINGLLDELELKEGLNEQLKVENSNLQAVLEGENQDKEVMQKELMSLKERITSLKTELDENTKARTELEARVQELQGGTVQAIEPQSVELEEIVVAPNSIPSGVVLRVNTRDDFVIIDLGQTQGVVNGLVFSVYRGSKYIGDIKISRVQAEMSVGDFIPPLRSRQVRKNDKVVVKE